jgi:hypothetical protein
MTKDILQGARDGQNPLERLMNVLPGFRGYREKELRRDADKILREHLARRLDLAKKSLDEAATALTRSGGLAAMNDIETARKRLDKVANRIRYADRGYAPLFAVVKVKDDTLERVYGFDLSLVEGVDAVTSALARIAAEGPAAVTAAIAEMDALDARVTDRETLLRGIQ